MRLQRLRLELRMELAAEEIGMVGNFNYLNICSVRGCSGDAEAAAGQHRFILAVEFITVAMALTDLHCAISFAGLAVRFQLAGPRAQSHGPTQFVDTRQLTQF